MSLKINIDNNTKVKEAGISGIDPFKLVTNKTGNKFSFNIYIPTIVTESIYRSNMTDLLTDYNEKAVAVYSFKRTEISNMVKWSLYFGASVASIIAAIVLYNKHGNKSSKHPFLLEAININKNTFTKIDMNDSSEMNIISLIVDIINDIDIIKTTDPKVYKSKANKAANLINYSITKPSVICFLDEFEDVHSKNKDILDKYNFVTLSSLDDRVTCIVSVSKETFYSTTSLSKIKKDLNIDDVQLSNLDKISRDYKTKVV